MISFIFVKLTIKMIRGTNHDQDARFADKTKKMLEKSQWPEKYDIKIDLKKIDYELIKVWIEKRITKLLGEEDDIVSGTIISHLDQHLDKEQKVNAKNFHVAITAVLQDKTLTFVSQLWDLLDQAQRSPRGIPECLIEDKKKSQVTHRRKLHQMQEKKHKINVNRFNQTMRGEEFRRGKYDYKASEEGHQERDRSPQYRRDRSPQHAQKKKKHRERRSRSESRHNKRTSRSPQKRRERSRDKNDKYDREKRKDEHQDRQKNAKQKTSKRSKRAQSSESDSSGVVSSSSSSSD